jgi:hypothetical protein
VTVLLQIALSCLWFICPIIISLSLLYACIKHQSLQQFMKMWTHVQDELRVTTILTRNVCIAYTCVAVLGHLFVLICYTYIVSTGLSSAFANNPVGIAFHEGFKFITSTLCLAAFVYPLVLYVVTCKITSKLFALIYKQLKQDLNQPWDFSVIQRHRAHHQTVCQKVECMDRFMSIHIAIALTFDQISFDLALFVMLWNSLDNSMETSLLQISISSLSITRIVLYCCSGPTVTTEVGIGLLIMFHQGALEIMFV